MDKQLINEISMALPIKGNSNPREATLAALEARHLLDKYNEGITFSADMVKEASIAQSDKFPNWVRELFTLLTKAFDVDYYVDEYNDHQDLIAIGMEMDVEVCKQVFILFRHIINDQLKDKLKDNYFKSKKDFDLYAAGILEIINDRISMESRTRYASIAAEKKDLIKEYHRKNNLTTDISSNS